MYKCTCTLNFVECTVEIALLLLLLLLCCKIW